MATLAVMAQLGASPAAYADDEIPAHATAERMGALCRSLESEHHWEADPHSWPTSGLKAVRCMKGDVPDGPLLKVNSRGQVMVEGEYREGQVAGHWTRYFDDGARRDEGVWKDGKPDGVWMFADDKTHRPKERVRYRGGEKICVEATFTPEGQEQAGDCTGAGAGMGELIHRVGVFSHTWLSADSTYSSVGVKWEPYYRWLFLTASVSLSRSAATARFFPVTQLGLGARVELGQGYVVSGGAGAETWHSVAGLSPVVFAGVERLGLGGAERLIPFARYGILLGPPGALTHEWMTGLEYAL